MGDGCEKLGACQNMAAPWLPADETGWMLVQLGNSCPSLRVAVWTILQGIVATRRGIGEVKGQGNVLLPERSREGR